MWKSLYFLLISIHTALRGARAAFCLGYRCRCRASDQADKEFATKVKKRGGSRRLHKTELRIVSRVFVCMGERTLERSSADHGLSGGALAPLCASFSL